MWATATPTIWFRGSGWRSGTPTKICKGSAHRAAKGKKGKGLVWYLLSLFLIVFVSFFLYARVISDMSDSKYFSTTKKGTCFVWFFFTQSYIQNGVHFYLLSAIQGELAELRQDLQGDKRDRKKDAIKKIIASMTVGKDVSSLFPDVVNCMQTDNLELKKLVYLYLMNYAKSQPDLAILAVNTFSKVWRPFLFHILLIYGQCMWVCV